MYLFAQHSCIQWAKAQNKKDLFQMLQSRQCVYFRCAREGDGIAGDGNKWYLHPAGADVKTDSFWQHRFGTIRTMWAGTNEHSMTNWYLHAKIWEHFDQFLDLDISSIGTRLSPLLLPPLMTPRAIPRHLSPPPLLKRVAWSQQQSNNRSSRRTPSLLGVWSRQQK
jgi:hypothetical protein